MYTVFIREQRVGVTIPAHVVVYRRLYAVVQM